jgi:hypothetical protein
VLSREHTTVSEHQLYPNEPCITMREGGRGCVLRMRQPLLSAQTYPCLSVPSQHNTLRNQSVEHHSLFIAQPLHDSLLFHSAQTMIGHGCLPVQTLCWIELAVATPLGALLQHLLMTCVLVLDASRGLRFVALLAGDRRLKQKLGQHSGTAGFACVLPESSDKSFQLAGASRRN